MDGHSRHDHQKRDPQVSRKGVVDSCKGDKSGKDRSKGGSAKRKAFFKVLVHVYIVLVCYLKLMNIVIRL